MAIFLLLLIISVIIFAYRDITGYLQDNSKELMVAGKYIGAFYIIAIIVICVILVWAIFIALMLKNDARLSEIKTLMSYLSLLFTVGASLSIIMPKSNKVKRGIVYFIILVLGYLFYLVITKKITNPYHTIWLDISSLGLAVWGLIDYLRKNFLRKTK
jgi:uncharacterized membrane protein (UPF0136 family)